MGDYRMPVSFSIWNMFYTGIHILIITWNSIPVCYDIKKEMKSSERSQIGLVWIIRAHLKTVLKENEKEYNWNIKFSANSSWFSYCVQMYSINNKWTKWLRRKKASQKFIIALPKLLSHNMGCNQQ